MKQALAYTSGSPAGEEQSHRVCGTAHFHVADADAVAARMVAAGGTTLREVEDQADGERRGTFLDPFGYRWMIGQSIGTEPADG